MGLEDGYLVIKSLPWSLAFIEKYEDKWDWKELSENEALPWSLELIERFEDKWDWRGVIRVMKPCHGH